MLKAIAGKDPCPNCGELLIGNSAPRATGSAASSEAICAVCKIPFDHLELIENGLAQPMSRRENP